MNNNIKELETLLNEAKIEEEINNILEELENNKELATNDAPEAVENGAPEEKAAEAKEEDVFNKEDADDVADEGKVVKEEEELATNDAPEAVEAKQPEDGSFDANSAEWGFDTNTVDDVAEVLVEDEEFLDEAIELVSTLISLDDANLEEQLNSITDNELALCELSCSVIDSVLAENVVYSSLLEGKVVNNDESLMEAFTRIKHFLNKRKLNKQRKVEDNKIRERESDAHSYADASVDRTAVRDAEAVRDKKVQEENEKQQEYEQKVKNAKYGVTNIRNKVSTAIQAFKKVKEHNNDIKTKKNAIKSSASEEIKKHKEAMNKATSSDTFDEAKYNEAKAALKKAKADRKEKIGALAKKTGIRKEYNTVKQARKDAVVPAGKDLEKAADARKIADHELKKQIDARDKEVAAKKKEVLDSDDVYNKAVSNRDKIDKKLGNKKPEVKAPENKPEVKDVKSTTKGNKKEKVVNNMNEQNELINSVVDTLSEEGLLNSHAKSLLSEDSGIVEDYVDENPATVDAQEEGFNDGVADEKVELNPEDAKDEIEQELSVDPVETEPDVVSESFSRIFSILEDINAELGTNDAPEAIEAGAPEEKAADAKDEDVFDDEKADDVADKGKVVKEEEELATNDAPEAVETKQPEGKSFEANRAEWGFDTDNTDDVADEGKVVKEEEELATNDAPEAVEAGEPEEKAPEAKEEDVFDKEDADDVADEGQVVKEEEELEPEDDDEELEPEDEEDSDDEKEDDSKEDEDSKDSDDKCDKDSSEDKKECKEEKDEDSKDKDSDDKSDDKKDLKEAEEQSEDKQFDIDATLASDAAAELGTEENKEDIEDKKDECPECGKAECECIKEYHSIAEAVELGHEYFLNEDNKNLLIEQIALTLANENKDRLFKELVEATALANRLEEAIVAKYANTATARFITLFEEELSTNDAPEAVENGAPEEKAPEAKEEDVFDKEDADDVADEGQVVKEEEELATNDAPEAVESGDPEEKAFDADEEDLFDDDEADDVEEVVVESLTDDEILGYLAESSQFEANERNLSVIRRAINDGKIQTIYEGQLNEELSEYARKSRTERIYKKMEKLEQKLKATLDANAKDKIASKIEALRVKLNALKAKDASKNCNESEELATNDAPEAVETKQPEDGSFEANSKDWGFDTDKADDVKEVIVENKRIAKTKSELNH